MYCKWKSFLVDFSGLKIFWTSSMSIINNYFPSGALEQELFSQHRFYDINEERIRTSRENYVVYLS